MNKYMKIYTTIVEEIMNGTYRYLQQLPSEHELSKKYIASRETVRKALNLLQEKGYIQKLRGKGSVVIYEQITQFPISEIISFQEINQQMNLNYETVVEGIVKVHAKDVPHVQHALELKDKDQLWHVIRTRRFKNKVHILDEDYFLCEIVPHITEEIAKKSIYKYIELTLKKEISYSNKTITFEKITVHETQFFGDVDPPYTASVKGTVYLSDATPFQYNISRHLATEFKFVEFSRRVKRGDNF